MPQDRPWRYRMTQTSYTASVNCRFCGSTARGAAVSRAERHFFHADACHVSVISAILAAASAYWAKCSLTCPLIDDESSLSHSGHFSSSVQTLFEITFSADSYRRLKRSPRVEAIRLSRSSDQCIESSAVRSL